MISTNKCSTEAHCQTCSCFKEEIKIDSVSVIRKSMAEVEYEIKTLLPTGPVRDVCLIGDKILETDIKGDKVYRDVKFRHYNSTEISKRVTRNKFKYEMRSLNTYKKQKEESHTYLNFKNGLTEYEAVMKYTIENKIKYSADGFAPTMIAFDVEAFHPTITDRSVVPSHKNGGIISMICATFSKPSEIDRFVVYILT